MDDFDGAVTEYRTSGDPLVPTPASSGMETSSLGPPGVRRGKARGPARLARCRFAAPSKNAKRPDSKKLGADRAAEISRDILGPLVVWAIELRVHQDARRVQCLPIPSQLSQQQSTGWYATSGHIVCSGVHSRRHRRGSEPGGPSLALSGGMETGGASTTAAPGMKPRRSRKMRCTAPPVAASVRAAASGSRCPLEPRRSAQAPFGVRYHPIAFLQTKRPKDLPLVTTGGKCPEAFPRSAPSRRNVGDRIHRARRA